MLKHTKLLTSVVTAAVLAGSFTVCASASSVTGRVNVNTCLHVRSAATTEAPIIGRMDDGTRVTILSRANGWDKISYNGGEAWICGQYVTSGDSRTVVSAAQDQLGVPYRWGASSPSHAFDCSGLTMYAYSKAGIRLPHSANGQATYGSEVSRSSLQPGDLLFFNTYGSSGAITHCGIYVGGNQFISAEDNGVKKASLGNSYWSRAYVTARQLIC